MGQDQGEPSGGEAHRHVKDDFGQAEVPVPGGGHRPDEGLPREHGHVGRHLQVHPEAQNQAAQEEEAQLPEVGLGGDGRQGNHGQVNEPPKEEGDGHLEPVLPLELLFQDGQLDQNDEQVKEDGELPQGQGCIQTEHIGDGGDGGGPQVRRGDKAHPQGVDEQADGEDGVPFGFLVHRAAASFPRLS